MKMFEKLRVVFLSKKLVTVFAILFSFSALALIMSLNFAFAESYQNLAGNNWGSQQNQGCTGSIQQNGSELYFKVCQYESKGRFVDGRTVVADQWGVRGTVSSDFNRIDWTNGNVWFRSGSGGGSVSLTVEYDTDRMYGDYLDYDLPRADFELCRSACAADSRCKAYTYVKPGGQGSSARCWLKSSVPNAARSTCCISGVKK